MPMMFRGGAEGCSCSYARSVVDVALMMFRDGEGWGGLFLFMYMFGMLQCSCTCSVDDVMLVMFRGGVGRGGKGCLCSCTCSGGDVTLMTFRGGVGEGC